MKYTVFNMSSCAAISLRIGIVIVITVIIAAAAYRTPAIMQLLGQHILIALLCSLLFVVYIFCVLVAAAAAAVLSVVGLTRTGESRAAALAGLVLNAGVLVLLADMFSGGRLFCFGSCH